MVTQVQKCQQPDDIEVCKEKVEKHCEHVSRDCSTVVEKHKKLVTEQHCTEAPPPDCKQTCYKGHCLPAALNYNCHRKKTCYPVQKWIEVPVTREVG